jgi:hypothetical protein
MPGYDGMAPATGTTEAQPVTIIVDADGNPIQPGDYMLVFKSDYDRMAAELLAARSELAAQKETREYLKCAGAGVRRLRDELAAARTWCEVLQKAGMSAEESRDFALDERDALKLDNARLTADLAQTVERLGEAREVVDEILTKVSHTTGRLHVSQDLYFKVKRLACTIAEGG